MERYNRQTLFFGQAGQEKLKKAKVIVVGLGGLGSAILNYLVAAGIGTIKAIDKDKVDITNLNRQILHWTSDIGRKKTDSAKEKLKKLNPTIKIEVECLDINKKNIEKVIKDYDIIVDALDNLQTRFILSDACKKFKKNFVFGVVEGMKGFQATNVDLRKIFKKVKVSKGKFPIIGATAGVIGALEALEVTKLILGLKINNKLLVFNGKNNTFNYIKI